MAFNGPAVQTGYWIDHSKGVVLGGTLTYRSNAGAQLISAATILVQLTGASLWAILAFYLHQSAVSRGLRDEFDAQKQVVLRNTPSTISTIETLYHLGSTWHGRTQQAWTRALGHMALPFLVFVGFAVAGVFVGQIAENPYNGQVLLQPGTCGQFVQNAQGFATTIRSQQLIANVSSVANSYARDCYSRSTTDSVSCTSYATPRISYTTGQNGSCPIGAGNCQTSDDGAFTLQALDIDSHHDLGINAKASERLQLKYNVTCAPVNRQLVNSLSVFDYSEGVRDNTTKYPLVTFEVGEETMNGLGVPYTYSSVLLGWGAQATAYSLFSLRSSYPHQGATGWIPVSPFNLSQADITMFIVAPNGLVYSAPNSDLIFSTNSTSSAVNSDYYVPDYLFRALVCGESYQVCKDEGSSCTAWAPLGAFLDQAGTLGITTQQNATWQRIIEVIGNSNMYQATKTPSPLRASDQIAGPGLSAGLPDNQWTLEVESWFQAVLSRMQYVSQSFAVLPTNFLEQATQAGYEILAPDTPELQAQCATQRIQTPPGYSSYNVFALVFILVVAVVIISASLCLAEHGHRIPSRRPGGKDYNKLMAYQADGMLQLQRMAFEGAGVRGWRSGKGHKKVVPYTEHGEARIPPSIVETKIQGTHDNGDPTGQAEDEGWNDGLLYYEKVHPAGDESDEPFLHK